MMLICFVVICPKMRLVTSGWSYADKVVTQFHTNSLFISYHDSSLLDFHVYFGLKCVDRKCMNNVQGRRPNEEKVCLPTLLENVEGQAQVDGKVEGNWMCQKKSNKKHKTTTNQSPTSFAVTAAPNAETTRKPSRAAATTTDAVEFVVVFVFLDAVEFVVVLCFLLLVFLARQFSFNLSIHLSLSFRIFQQCRKANSSSSSARP